MFRLLPIALLLLAIAGAPAFASDDIEASVREIERLSTAAPVPESNAKIDALSSRMRELTLEQRQRIEFVRLRNLGITGKQHAALQGTTALLQQEIAPALRVRIMMTGISMAANAENWSLAFSWLNDSLAYLPETPEQSPQLFNAASYLYTLVGETGKARELALRAVAEIDPEKNPSTLCRAFGAVALSEDHADNFREAENWRHRQIEACTRAQDPVFIANGKYGIGKMAAKQGRYTEALQWADEALHEFERVGFVAGAYSARLVMAGSLLALKRDLRRVETLLDGTLTYYQEQNSALAIAETEQLLGRLAEAHGHQAAALAHLKAAMKATAEADRSARERRLAYLQIQFDTQLKEQQIALLKAEKALAEVQATAVQRRQLLLALGLGGLLITAVLLSILLRRAARERQRYRWQSEHDSLTGLYNYQQVRKLGEAAFARARGCGRPFTAVVIDIDLFKQVNDRYGHAAGDEALRCLGAWIAETAGAGAIAGRSGGDEFTILLEADAAKAEAMLHCLRGRVEPVTVFGHTFRFNISAGVCQADERTPTLEELVHEADQALYRAKHGGRDRVVRAGEPASGSDTAARLVVVGSGIQFGRHASGRCLSEIRVAQVVFCLTDPFTLAMISASRPDTINLGIHYATGKDRRQTYRDIDAAIMTEVRAGRRVCAVFYGHPGVFAGVPHEVIRKARAEGFPARMEPGISAEACLYADLGLDPGRRGVQSMEATHFLVYDRQPDPAGLVLLWQVALAGDLTCSRLHAEREGLQALVEKLLRWYPPEHEVILYEAARLPIEAARADRVGLRDLPDAHYEEYTTLVIPPLWELQPDERAVGRMERA